MSKKGWRGDRKGNGKKGTVNFEVTSGAAVHTGLVARTRLQVVWWMIKAEKSVCFWPYLSYLGLEQQQWRT